MRSPEGDVFAAKYLQADPVESVACLICGSENAKLWYSMGRFRSLVCRDCGCRYVSPRYSDEQLDAHYSEALFTQSQDYEGRRHNMLQKEERERKRLDMKEEIKETLDHCKDGKVLDVGCQTGIYLEALPESIQKFGVERSEWAAEHTRRITGATVSTGKVEDANYSPASFDVINMSYVLEHFQRPVETMQIIAGWLKPGGRLIVSVPNFDSLCARMFKEFYRLADPRQHIFLTTPASVGRLLRMVDVGIVRKYFPYFGTPYCRVGEQSRLVVNAFRLKTRCVFPPLRRLSVSAAKLVSPPFYGNIMTVVGQKGRA